MTSKTTFTFPAMDHDSRFDHILNPTAQEFRPTYHHPLPQPHTYYPYTICHPLPPPTSATPTRTLLLSTVPSDVSETIIRRDLEVFGDVRAVQMERVRHGLVTVYFYNLRQSIEALHKIQEQHMQQQYRLRTHFDAPWYNYYGNCYYSSMPLAPPAPGLIAGHAVWAQFTFPVAADIPDGYNQGALAVFNLDSDATLKESFVAFGRVKEFRGMHLEKNQKFVEFYDTRDAAKALKDINGKKINGKTVVVEFSRPGGHKNGPKQSTFNPISSSIRPPPVILARKFGSKPRSYPPPPPPLSDSLRKTVNKQPQPQQSDAGAWSKQWKGSRQARNKHYPRYFIKEDGIISESSILDSRTTVMIKNIPNKYSRKLLLNMLDNHCIHCNEQITDGGGDGGNDVQEPLSSYDFVYLPIDFMNKCNVGYGFVNMTSAEATMRLYKAFHHQNWEVFNSKKICEVSYARLQGLDALKEHFKIARFPYEAEEYMPVLFAPPRDGQRLTEPTPIVGRSMPRPLQHELCSADNECRNSSSYVTVVGDVESNKTLN